MVEVVGGWGLVRASLTRGLRDAALAYKPDPVADGGGADLPSCLPRAKDGRQEVVLEVPVFRLWADVEGAYCRPWGRWILRLFCLASEASFLPRLLIPGAVAGSASYRHVLQL